MFSGPDYFFKVANGDELYSVTAVYLTNDIKGKMQVDKSESVEIKFFNLESLPNDLTDEYLSYITPFAD